MKKTYQDNYKTVLKKWEEMSLTWDWERRFAELGLKGYRESRPQLTYFGTVYEWDNMTGRCCKAADPAAELDFAEAMNLYQIIYHQGSNPKLSGEWIPLREVKRAYPFDAAFKAATLVPFAKYFDGKMNQLLAAGERLGFKRIADSEAGLEAMVFDCLPIRFLFWDGDDEFAAQANILFDSNITDFVHEENVVMIGSDGVKRLMAAAEG